MASECMFCGGACGRVCRGLGFNNTPEASGKARKAPSGKAVSAPAPMTDPSRNSVRASTKNETDNRSAGRKPDKSPSRTAAPGDVRPRGLSVTNLIETVPAAVTNSKRGRPRIGEDATKPWIALGLTERTYYRRRAEEKAK